ncbi:MAG: serine hydrolase [Acidobacteriota bacterium]|jgi:CubicO group peptidase (beta-lactamase class C family)
MHSHQGTTIHAGFGSKLRSGVATSALLLLTTTLLAAAPAPAQTAPASADLATRLDTLFTETYPSDGPGAAVLIERGDQIVLRKGYGLADVELGVPIAPDMVFRLGSITKQLTAAAVLLLVDEGKLALDMPLGEALPDYEGPAARVTLHQLLTHTAGVPSYTSMESYADGMREDVTVEEMIDRFRDEPLDFEPGTDWAYSNSGYFLLGAVIEAASGTSYEDFVETRIFAPLGMHRSRYGRVSEVVPGRVEGYQGAGDGLENAAYLSMTQPYSAGSLLSTVDDLSLWVKALRGERLLPDDLRELLWTPATLADGRSTGYGYGLGVAEYQGRSVLQHGGGINGFLTSILWIPEEEIFVTVLANTMAARPAPGELALRAATETLGVPLDERPSVELPPEVLDEYVGVYTIDGTGGDDEQTRVVTREGDRLFTQRTGGAKNRVRFSEEDRIFYPDSLTTARFERGEDGRVTGMWMAPGFGPEEHATRTDRPLPEPRREAEIESERLDALLERYVGRYELAPGAVMTITREGNRLYAQLTGQPRFEVFPESETRFFLKVVDAVIEFHGAEDGPADAVTLYQGGREMKAERVE